MLGMMIPMIRRGTFNDVRLVKREDYIGDDDAVMDEEGTPWAGAEVVREDGVDSYAYAPKAGN